MNFVEYDEPILELVQEQSRFGECEAVGLTRAGQRNGGLSGQGDLKNGELAAWKAVGQYWFCPYLTRSQIIVD